MLSSSSIQYRHGQLVSHRVFNFGITSTIQTHARFSPLSVRRYVIYKYHRNKWCVNIITEHKKWNVRLIDREMADTLWRVCVRMSCSRSGSGATLAPVCGQPSNTAGHQDCWSILVWSIQTCRPCVWWRIQQWSSVIVQLSFSISSLCCQWKACTSKYLNTWSLIEISTSSQGYKWPWGLLSGL